MLCFTLISVSNYQSRIKQQEWKERNKQAGLGEPHLQYKSEQEHKDEQAN